MDLRQLPALAGPIVVVYSKDVTGTLGLEVDAGLNLSMEMVADMFAGRTLYWDHEDVRALNPHVALPHERIHAVVRSDKSGMTGTFTAGQLASLASRMACACCTLHGQLATPCLGRGCRHDIDIDRVLIECARLFRHRKSKSLVDHRSARRSDGRQEPHLADRGELHRHPRSQFCRSRRAGLWPGSSVPGWLLEGNGAYW